MFKYMMESKVNPYQIREAIRTFKASPYLLHKDRTDLREYWLTSELFQVLRVCFMNTDYQVRVEHVAGKSIEVRPDLLVEGDNRIYPIEVKRLNKNTDFDRLRGQVDRYKSQLDSTRVFVVAFAADNTYLPENNQDVQRQLEEIEGKNVEVFVKGRRDVVSY